MVQVVTVVCGGFLAYPKVRFADFRVGCLLVMKGTKYFLSTSGFDTPLHS